MLTIDNYFDKVQNLDLSSLHPTLQESHEWVKELTNEGRDWSEYRTNGTIKEVVDLHLQQMDLYQKKHKGNVKVQPRTRLQKYQSPANNILSTESEGNNVHLVPRIPDELRFIKRFVNMHNKNQTKSQVLNFINSLQKAIIEKRIRKASQWAEQITYIQKNLISTYNSMGNDVRTVLKPNTLNKFRRFIDNEKVFPSVGIIKRYIGLHQKADVRNKAISLLTYIDKTLDKAQIRKGDPYMSELQAIKSNLQSFIADKNIKLLAIESATLAGLKGIVEELEGCSCATELSGLKEQSNIISSVDFVKQQYPTIGFTGKYRDFIGDPSPGFTAMISAKPKFGKSTLCADFAGYLARMHGNVLFVAKEEGFSKTLQDKLKDVQHPRLMVTDYLPADLEEFQYVFLDSVTRLGLTSEDLRKLKLSYPGICFMFVFQVTKDGRFRGANDFQHDVDIVIELPQPGKAIQFGRYNQGGTMNIFDIDQ